MLNWHHSRVQFIIRRHPKSLDRRRASFSINRRSDFHKPQSSPSSLNPPVCLPAYNPGVYSTGTTNSLVFHGAISGGNIGYPGDRLSMRRHWSCIMWSCEIYDRGKNVLNFKRAKFINDRGTHDAFCLLIVRQNFLRIPDFNLNDSPTTNFKRRENIKGITMGERNWRSLKRKKKYSRQNSVTIFTQGFSKMIKIFENIDLWRYGSFHVRIDTEHIAITRVYKLLLLEIASFWFTKNRPNALRISSQSHVITKRDYKATTFQVVKTAG